MILDWRVSSLEISWRAARVQMYVMRTQRLRLHLAAGWDGKKLGRRIRALYFTFRNDSHLKRKKVKFTLEQTAKAQRGSRGIAILLP